MKRSLYICCLFLLFSGVAIAQNGQKTIVEDLNTPKRGQGQVKVYQDESIQNTVAVYSEEDPNAATGYVKAKGYKIQVFSGNNQRQSKLEAESKLSQVKSAYPDLEATVTYNAPSWKLRVGNFTTREDAENVLKEMKSTFPSFGKEMHVVSDIIKRPANQ